MGEAAAPRRRGAPAPVTRGAAIRRSLADALVRSHVDRPAGAAARSREQIAGQRVERGLPKRIPAAARLRAPAVSPAAARGAGRDALAVPAPGVASATTPAAEPTPADGTASVHGAASTSDAGPVPEAAPGRRRPDAVEPEAAAERRGREVPAPRIPPPAVAVPREARRSVDPEVRPRSPAPDPRRNQPGPSVGGIVDVHVRFAVPGRRRVGVCVPIRHPHPAVLVRVDPLTRRNGLGGLGLGLASRRRRRLHWRSRRRLRWRSRRRLRRRRGCLGSRLGGSRRHRGRAVVVRPDLRRKEEQRPGQDKCFDEGSHGLHPMIQKSILRATVPPHDNDASRRRL